MALVQLGSGPMPDRMAMKCRSRIDDHLGAFSYDFCLYKGLGVTFHLRSLFSCFGLYIESDLR